MHVGKSNQVDHEEVDQTKTDEVVDHTKTDEGLCSTSSDQVSVLPIVNVINTQLKFVLHS